VSAAAPPVLPFRRERLAALATLALPVPIPLLFTRSLELWVYLFYAAGVGLLLWRVSRGRLPALRNAILNLVGFAGAMAFYADLRYVSHSLLKATVHLLLLVTAVRLWSIQRERDFSFALALVGFLFVGSVATSFHYSVALFVLGFLALAWPALVRWALWRDLAAAPEEWTRRSATAAFPERRAIVASVLATLAAAIPFFVALPRLKAPLITGLPERRELVTGFSETVDPDVYGTLKQSDRVYLRVSRDVPFSERGGAPLQIRAIAFALHDGRTWAIAKRSRTTPIGPPGRLLPLVSPRRARREAGAGMTIDLLPLGSRYVPVPAGSLALQLSEASFRTSSGYLDVDDLDNLLLTLPPERTIQYQVFGEGLAAPGAAPGPDDPSRRRPGSARLAGWARSVLGDLDAETEPFRAAAALSARLATTLTYSLEVWRPGPNPVEEFVFEKKSGTCENFATALALALREVGVPTRFVTGFAGGEIGLLGRYLIVRGRDAHAWVEAWCGPERGWQSFDPTPPAGRPTLQRVPWTRRLKQLTDGLEFAYDRYILSFSQGDQLDLVQRLRATASGLTDSARAAGRAIRAAVSGTRLGAWIALPIGMGLLALAVLLARIVRGLPWRTGGLAPGSAAYRRLQRQLVRRGASLTPASAPGETLVAAAEFGAGVAAPARAVVEAYARESFGGRPLAPSEIARLEASVLAVRDALRGVSRRSSAASPIGA